MNYLVQLVSNFPPDLATGLLAIMPVGELRLALPVGIEVFGLRPAQAFFVSLVGNAIPALVVVFGLDWGRDWADQHWRWAHRIIMRVEKRTDRVTRGKYEKYGLVALFLLTAIPLPLTGVWTASVAAVIFNINPKRSLPAILGGMVVAGIIVLSLTLGAEGVIGNMK